MGLPNDEAQGPADSIDQEARSVETNHEVFRYTWCQSPVAERARREVINLPVHQRVKPSDIERTLAFLRERAVRA